MSTFKVEVRSISAIEPHLNADALEFVVIDGYRAIVRKGLFVAGQPVVYIPEGAVATPFVLNNICLWDAVLGKGRCAGDNGLRVKALMLRGALSQGLIYPLTQRENHWQGPGWYLQDELLVMWAAKEGDDVAALLGITKYKPEIPAELAGLVFDGGIELMPRFDIEDVKKHPAVLVEGEQVVMSEKLHGTFGGFMLLPPAMEHPEHGDFCAFSKGLSEQALAFQDVPENDGNVYVQAARKFGLRAKLLEIRRQMAEVHGSMDEPVFLFGEILGSASRQDLKYGQSMGLAVFDIGFGGRSSPRYLDRDDMCMLARSVGLAPAPEIYRGAFGQSVLQSMTSGKETYSGKALHIREGVVVRPLQERRDPVLGRVILKSVSPNYLVRGGAATEYS